MSPFQKCMGLIVFAIGLNAAAQTPADYKTFIQQWEGCKHTPYRDTNGWTVGIGHSLTAKGEKVESYYTTQQIDTFFYQDLDGCLKSARRIIPAFDTLPTNAKLVVVSLIFNLGENGFVKFKKFIRAVNSRNFMLASDELKDSVWFNQVGRRARNHTNLLNEIRP